MNETTKLKISTALKKSWSDPEVRALRTAAKITWHKKSSASAAASWVNPEVRARRSAALKAAWEIRRAKRAEEILKSALAEPEMAPVIDILAALKHTLTLTPRSRP